MPTSLFTCLGAGLWLLAVGAENALDGDAGRGCAGGACTAPSDSTYLLQHAKTKTASSNKTECSPCQIRIEISGRPNLELDIYEPSTISEEPRPIVMVHHGSGGDVTTMWEQCTYIFVPAGYVCVSIDPINNEDRPAYHTDVALQWLLENAATYNADPEMVILYGHSKGGRSVFEYMHWSEETVRGQVKAMIEDAASPAGERYDWKKKDALGVFWPFPPLLMLHCAGDPNIAADEYVKEAIKDIEEANLVRGKSEKIHWHYLEFAAETGCSHSALLVNAWDAADGAVTFIKNIVAGSPVAEVFAGIPDLIDSPGSATGSRRRRGKANWP